MDLQTRAARSQFEISAPKRDLLYCILRFAVRPYAQAIMRSLDGENIIRRLMLDDATTPPPALHPLNTTLVDPDGDTCGLVDDLLVWSQKRATPVINPKLAKVVNSVWEQVQLPPSTKLPTFRKAI